MSEPSPLTVIRARLAPSPAPRPQSLLLPLLAAALLAAVGVAAPLAVVFGPGAAPWTDPAR